MKMFFRALLSVILILAVLILPQKLYSGLNEDKISSEMYRRREAYYYGVINLWQVDSFEGGTGSRTNWLKSVVGGFEKKHNGVYVNVESVTPEIALSLIASGQKKPDIISFGYGTGISEKDLSPINADLSALHKSLEEVTFISAVPWCMGAYVMIGDGESEVWGTDGKIITNKKGEKKIYSVGLAEKAGYGSETALKSYCANDFSGELALIRGNGQEMFEMYNYSQKTNRYIGTQRDLYRKLSAEKKDKSRGGAVTYIDTYSDLFQFIGVLNQESEKKNDVMQDFVSYLLSDEVQSKLGSVGMFPVNINAAPEYESPDMQAVWEKVKSSHFKCETQVFKK